MHLKDPIIVRRTQEFGFLECHVNTLIGQGSGLSNTLLCTNKEYIHHTAYTKSNDIFYFFYYIIVRY